MAGDGAFRGPVRSACGFYTVSIFLQGYYWTNRQVVWFFAWPQGLPLHWWCNLKRHCQVRPLIVGIKFYHRQDHCFDCQALKFCREATTLIRFWLLMAIFLKRPKSIIPAIHRRINDTICGKCKNSNRSSSGQKDFIEKQAFGLSLRQILQMRCLLLWLVGFRPSTQPYLIPDYMLAFWPRATRKP